MIIDIRALAVAGFEVGDDVVRAVVDDGSVLEYQRGDLIRARLAAKLLAVARIGWNLARDERHAELGHALTDATRMWAPLGLVELIHGVVLPVTERGYDCWGRWRDAARRAYSRNSRSNSGHQSPRSSRGLRARHALLANTMAQIMTGVSAMMTTKNNTRFDFPARATANVCWSVRERPQGQDCSRGHEYVVRPATCRRRRRSPHRGQTAGLPARAPVNQLRLVGTSPYGIESRRTF